MQAKLKMTVLASLAACVLSSAGIAATELAAMMARHAPLPPAPTANLLLQPVLWKPDATPPHGFSTKEKSDIQQAVRTQIRAYAARDAERAFARLAPATQRFFGKPDKFLRSLAQEMPAVLDTRHFAFLGVERSGQRAVQQVLLTDGSGREWLAEFQLEQQRNQDWRVKGCVVQATPGQQA